MITSIKKSKGNLFDIYADDDFLCTLEDVDVVRLHLVDGIEVNIDELLELSKTSAARRDAIKLLLYKKYCSGDLIKKLRLKGHDIANSEAAAEHFRHLGYIDDLDYAKRYISDAVRLRREGSFLIKMALLEKGINQGDIENILSDYTDEQTENLKLLIEKGQSEDIEKLKRKLVYKGYNFNEINKYINEVERFEL